VNYSYQVFGLRIESFIELEELQPASETSASFPCIQIVEECIEDQDAFPTPSDESPVVFHATPKAFFFHIQGVGRYLSTPNKIAVQLDPHFDAGLFKTFLYGSVLSSSLYFNSLLPLHASAIEIDGNAIAFCGDSGAGKSTTAAIFEDAGYSMITDDVLSLKATDSGCFHCFPGPAVSKLNHDSMELTQRPIEDTEILIDKYHLYTRAWTTKDQLPLKAVFAIVSDNDASELEIQPLRGIEKIQTILRYLYRNYWISNFGVEDEVNKNAVALATQISVFKIQRPASFPIDPETMLSTIQQYIAEEAIA
jgi:hypothetical protein